VPVLICVNTGGNCAAAGKGHACAREPARTVPAAREHPTESRLRARTGDQSCLALAEVIAVFPNSACAGLRNGEGRSRRWTL